MRKGTIDGKITIFKSLAMSKFLHLGIITKVLNTVIEELKQIPKNFKIKQVKIKQSTLRNDFEDGGEGGLKSVDIEHKIASLKCFWVK